MKPLPDDALSAWSPLELAERLKGTVSHWYLVGGWALDVWHGDQTREHEDLEFAVFPENVSEFRALLPQLHFFAARNGALDYVAPSAAPPADADQLWGADMQERR